MHNDYHAQLAAEHLFMAALCDRGGFRLYARFTLCHPKSKFVCKPLK